MPVDVLLLFLCVLCLRGIVVVAGQKHDAREDRPVRSQQVGLRCRTAKNQPHTTEPLPEPHATSFSGIFTACLYVTC